MPTFEIDKPLGQKLKRDIQPLPVALSRGSFSRAKEYAANGLPVWRDLLVNLLSSNQEQTYFMFREAIKQLVEPIIALKEETPMQFFETVHELFEAVLSWHRDLHLLREGAPANLLAFPDYLFELERCLERGNITPLQVLLEKTEKAHLAIDRSGSPATTLESLCLN